MSTFFSRAAALLPFLLLGILALAGVAVYIAAWDRPPACPDTIDRPSGRLADMPVDDPSTSRKVDPTTRRAAGPSASPQLVGVSPSKDRQTGWEQDAPPTFSQLPTQGSSMNKMTPVLTAAALAQLVGAQTLPIPQYPADNLGFRSYNTDAGTGVSANKVYTHAINLGDATSYNLNGVLFTGVAAGNPSASGTTTGTDGKPSVLDLQNFNFNFDQAACRLELCRGGVATNVNAVTVGATAGRVGNRVRSTGGQLFCNTLTVNDGNSLAPVISMDGILPVVASTSATFAPGSKITPVHDDFNVQGRWMILKSPAITLPVGDPNDPAFFVAPSRKAVYKLTPGFDPADGMSALFLSCSKPGTIFMIR